MTDDPVLSAVKEFVATAREQIVLLRGEITTLRNENDTLKRSVAVLETRAPIPGPAGKDGDPGADGKDGRDGKDGERGERGADGIATPEELDARIEARFAELQVRNLADSWRGVWKQDEAPYRRGSITQYGGAPWLALQDTASRPGDGPETGWVLFAKSGLGGRR